MKKKICFAVVLVLAIFVLLVVGTITEYQYKHNHIMIYSPTDDEVTLLAEEYGIALSDNISISEVMLDLTHSDIETLYSIRISGVDDAYSFLTTNIRTEDEIVVENGNILINGSAIDFHNRISNYEGTDMYNGDSVTLWIWGGHDINNDNKPYKYPVTISFFYEGDSLKFIECGCRTYPFGSECSTQIRESHYWEDYIFYPVLPLFK